MRESSEEPKFSLRLIVDEEKQKVVLAEVCSDFVDVLFSFLTLPMGNIVRLLEKHRKSEIGCLSNLYKSVVNMSIDNFETEACKEMLMYPRSLKDAQCRKLKLNINPNDDDLKFFACCSSLTCKLCSNFKTSQCRCGKLMNQEIKLSRIHLSGSKVVDNIQAPLNLRFIIGNDLRVEVRSTELVLEKLNSLGYGDSSKLGEKVVDIGFREVLTLLECTLSSNIPLTDAFLNKQTTQSILKFSDLSSQCVKNHNNGDAEKKEITFSVILRKQDMKILFVECAEDFVDLLFCFLALPMELMEISTFGNIGNLFKSFKELTQVSTEKSMVPYYYSCQKQLQLLNIITQEPPVYYRCKVLNHNSELVFRLTKTNIYSHNKLVPVVLMDPKSHGRNQSKEGSGFVKKGIKFNVTDDLIVTTMTSTSAFCLLEKYQVHAKDLVVEKISISNTEATSLLRASLVISSALNTALRNLILKKKPNDKET